jgi:hypothetical protein
MVATAAKGKATKKAYDEILVDSEKAGTPPRRGEILEILEESYGIRYRVRWEDGHESVVHPVAGTVRIVHRERSQHEDPIDEASARESCCDAFNEVFR